MVAKVGGGEGLGHRCHGMGGAELLLVSDKTRTFKASSTHDSPMDEDMGASSCLYTDPRSSPPTVEIFPPLWVLSRVLFGSTPGFLLPAYFFLPSLLPIHVSPTLVALVGQGP